MEKTLPCILYTVTYMPKLHQAVVTNLMIHVMASPRLGAGLLGRHSLPPHCGDGRVNWCRSWAAGVGAGSGVVARAPVSN